MSEMRVKLEKREEKKQKISNNVPLISTNFDKTCYFVEENVEEKIDSLKSRERIKSDFRENIHPSSLYVSCIFTNIHTKCTERFGNIIMTPCMVCNITYAQ